MPYVALAPVAAEAIRALANARWARLAAHRPDLDAPLALQRHIIGRLIDLTDAVRAAGVPRLSLPAGYLAAKLQRGTPALAGEPIPMLTSTLGPGLIGFCEDLARGGAGDPAEHLRALIVEGRLEPGSILSASLARRQEAVRTGATHAGVSPDLLWLVAELAVSPLAYALQAHVLSANTDHRLVDALNAWPHGHCPACGSWPALAERLNGRRVLRCSFCAFAWEPCRSGCVYCDQHHATTTLEVGEARDDESVETCAVCRGYLKSLAVSQLSPFPLLAIDDLETTHLDVAAMSVGYGRPALRTS